MENRIPLAVIAGPTASGKTAAGVRVAQLLGGEVISADSMQIYKHLTVGTAKPLVQEMQGVPHHLIDFLEPSESFSVADYVRLADSRSSRSTKEGICRCWWEGPDCTSARWWIISSFRRRTATPQLREQLKGFAEQNGVQALWQRLDEVDPAAAQKIHPNNVGRVVRALEVFYTTGTPISRQQELSRQQPSPYRLCMMALGFRDRQKLYDRINLRSPAWWRTVWSRRRAGCGNRDTVRPAFRQSATKKWVCIWMGKKRLSRRASGFGRSPAGMPNGS